MNSQFFIMPNGENVRIVPDSPDRVFYTGEFNPVFMSDAKADAMFISARNAAAKDADFPSQWKDMTRQDFEKACRDIQRGKQ